MACLCVLQAALVLLGLLILFKIYLKFTTKWCKSKVCLTGKTVIVTGANVGIGYETALEFAKRGARVILGCRDETKATEARDRIVKETENKDVIVKIVDFSSAKSVKKFAEDIVESEKRLDILVNNAGVASMGNKLTEEGLQLLLQINYYGPVLLTILLTDLLKKSAPSRIINVSSVAAVYAKLDVDNLNKYPGPQTSYNNSKLCNILFTMHFAKLVEKYNITVYSLHPGAVNTEIFRKFQGWKKFLVDFVKSTFFKTAEEGAQTTLHTALQQGIEKHSGCHFVECQVVKTYTTAKIPDLPEKLWNKTVQLLKIEQEVNKIIST